MQHFIAELKRRNVFRVAAFYAGAGWLLVQIVTQVLPVFDVSGWAIRLVIAIVVLGFPLALLLAWVYEITPEGLKRESEVNPTASITQLTGRRLDFMIIGVLGLIVIYFLADRFVLPRFAKPVDKSIAVLPFVNDSGDSANEYFSDGLSEDLISALGQVPDLRVIARTSSFQFKNRAEDAKAIGAKLAVAHLLEGSVRRIDDRVRIVVSLVDTANDSQLWSQQFDRELKDIFAVQSEIARSVAAAMKIEFLSESAASRAVDAPPGGNVDAYKAFLQGSFEVQRRSEESMRAAIRYFDAAIAIDPNYAQAYARSSSVWSALASAALSGQEATDAYAKARANAERALALDANLAAGHVALGWLLLSSDWNMPAAEAELRRAVELAPADSHPKFALAAALASLGKLPEAIQLTHQAIAIDPLRYAAHFNLAAYLAASGRLDEAEASLHTAIALQPDAAAAYQNLAVIEAERGNGEAALVYARRESAENERAFALAMAQQARGDHAAADAALKALVDGYADEMAFQIATVYAYRHDADQAFAWLDRAYAVRDPGLTELLMNPFLLTYRADPRFSALCVKLGLPAPS